MVERLAGAGGTQIGEVLLDCLLLLLIGPESSCWGELRGVHEVSNAYLVVFEMHHLQRSELLVYYLLLSIDLSWRGYSSLQMSTSVQFYLRRAPRPESLHLE